MTSDRDKTSPFSFDVESQTWKPSTPIQFPSLAASEAIRIITWNIDFMQPFQPGRVGAALTYLEKYLQDKSEPTIILLQEILEISLEILLASPWVKENFQISHAQFRHGAGYYTISLIPRGIKVLSVFRVPLVMTIMGRDGLFVDLPIACGGPAADGSSRNVLRICNTHLESLQSGNNVRPLQLAQISTLLQPLPSPDMRVVAGLVAGDMNAISLNDEGLHRHPEIGLQDVYEASQQDIPSLGNSVGLGESEGHTWGYQPPCQYPPGRLDKILFTGALRPIAGRGSTCVERLGIGLTVKFDRGLEVWVTDHFGIAATFTVFGEEES